MAARVDVIVVNWNDRERTPQAVDSVLALSEARADPHFVRIIVADNGSSDGSVEYLRQRYGNRITLLENGANLGFGAGVNRALPLVNGEYIFLLNPDAEVHDGALSALVRFMDEHPRCAIAGPAIHESDGRIAESCGEFDSWAGAFLRSSGWGDLPFFRPYANGAKLRAWDYKSYRKVDLVIGAAMLIRRSIVEQIGLFDTRYFMYHEEVDFAKRVADAGFETWFVPDAHVTHTGQGSSGGKGVERYKQRSRRLYWVKHHGRLWYYSLSAALVARYVFYLAVLAAIALVIRRVV
jgi:hypothetical protein